jgi:D-arabinitol 4-dehydrogenase
LSERETERLFALVRKLKQDGLAIVYISHRMKEVYELSDRVSVLRDGTYVGTLERDAITPERPAWEKVGAEIVDSVLPYEEAKIRVLNATRSCVAWAGTLAGFEYIHEGARDAEIARFAHDYITQDVIPSLLPSPIDLQRYRDIVLDRFSNPHIRDTNERVAADGFTKLSGFVVPTLRDSFARDEVPAPTAILPALFLAFLTRWIDGELHIDYRDSLQDTAAIRAMLAAEDPIAAFGSDRRVWGGLTSDTRLIDAVRDAYGTVNRWLASRLDTSRRVN